MLKTISGAAATSIAPGTAVGNVTPGTAAFTTLTSSGVTSLATTTGAVDIGPVIAQDWSTAFYRVALGVSNVFNDGLPSIGLSNNLRFLSGWKYTTDGEGCILYLDSAGGLTVYTSPSGAAGAAAATIDRFTIQNTGNITIGVAGAQAARLAIRAGDASNVAVQLLSGSLKTVPLAGGIEFLTDDLYFTRTTGTARKKLAQTEVSGSLRVPVTGAARVGGDATLVAGTVTVATTAATAACFALLTRKTAGGTIGDLTYTFVAGTSITINSASATDTSTVSFMILEGF